MAAIGHELIDGLAHVATACKGDTEVRHARVQTVARPWWKFGT